VATGKEKQKGLVLVQVRLASRQMALPDDRTFHWEFRIFSSMAVCCEAGSEILFIIFKI